MKTLGFDTETRGLDWFNPDQRAFLLSWADDTGSYVCQPGDRHGVADFVRAVERADRLVAHNVPFDVHQIRATLDIDLLKCGKPVLDTNLLSRVAVPERQNNGRGYKLKDLAQDFIRPDANDAEQAIIDLAKSAKIKLKDNGGYYDTWRAYPKEMEHYALLDAEYARDLLPLFEGKLDTRNTETWNLERAVQPILIRAEERGVNVDQDVVQRLRTIYEPRAEQALDTVTKELGDIDLGSVDQLREALLKHGVPLYRKTEKDVLATHYFALAEFKDRFPVIDALLEWRAASKMLSTYIGPMTDRATVHPSFWQMGAWTGRMSCSRPNMQNLPARKEDAETKLREAFVPRPDHCFVVCDYDSIEIRLLAHYLNSPEYTQLIEEGLDPHAWMASQIWGGDISEYEKGSPGEKQRGDAKNVLFAIVYGAGAKRVSDMLAVDYATARSLVTQIKRTLPRYLELASTYKPLGRVPRKIEATGYVTTLMGRKQVVKRDKAYVGLNSLIQGGAADIFKAGLLAVDARVTPLGGAPVLFVHDEMVVEAPIEHAEEVLAQTIAGMEEAYDLSPALKVSGSIAYGSYAEGK